MRLTLVRSRAMSIRLKTGLKLAISIALFAVVLRQVDIGAVRQTLARADVGPLTLALLLSFAMAVTDAAQWRSVLLSLNHRMSPAAALLYSFSGSFFGMFAPSSMGVDVFRAAQMRRLGISTETAVRAVVSARLVAFVSLLMVIVTGLPIILSYNLALHNRILVVSTIAAGVILLTAILSLDRLRNLIPSLRNSAIFEKLASISRDLQRALTSSRYTPFSLLYATATHILRISIFASLALAFHSWVGFWAFYALIPIALLVAMVPITIGSWGVRELSVVFFLSWVSISAAAALSISVTFGILRLVVAGIGGVVWTITGSRHYNLQIADNPERNSIAADPGTARFDHSAAP